MMNIDQSNMNKKLQQESLLKQPPQPTKKPDDRGQVQIDCFVKIYDPNSKDVFLEARA
jgi:hypothetical protein